jgi:hypothetical protein
MSWKQSPLPRRKEVRSYDHGVPSYFRWAQEKARKHKTEEVTLQSEDFVEFEPSGPGLLEFTGSVAYRRAS